MRSLISEISYGFVLTHELLLWSSSEYERVSAPQDEWQLIST